MPSSFNLSSSTPLKLPEFDASEPSRPISHPIRTLNELGARSYFKSFHYPFNKAKTALPQWALMLPNRRRLLVCHDMAGGYGEDKWIQGGSNPEAFALWHWHTIDIFVYFSHGLVTLPPPCWTNAAHKHGTKVLGTFITESEDGIAICSTLLSSVESAQLYAERLTELAIVLGFDGWLINMEVNLNVKQVPILLAFVRHLTRTLHSLLPGSLVIWYDSITADGSLKWQNQLNESNKPFFDMCDGIFVNYAWKVEEPRRSADIAADRKYDVYMGIDVFGRNTFGGGQWKTDVALDVLAREDVSAAIFAPGWVYETKQPPDFSTAQNCWWAKVIISWGILRSYPRLLPFQSNFDQGRGIHVSLDGKQISDTPWCNISCQGLQPLNDVDDDQMTSTIQTSISFKEASYSGGSCITFKGTLHEKAYFKRRLFKSELVFHDTPVIFTYSAKMAGKSELGFCVDFSSLSGERISVLIASMEQILWLDKFENTIKINPVLVQGEANEWFTGNAAIAMKGHTLTGIHAFCYLREALRNGEEYFAVLGGLSLKPSSFVPNFPHCKSWLVECDHVRWETNSNGSKNLSVKLLWKLRDGDAALFPKYYVYAMKVPKQDMGKKQRAGKYIGVAHVEMFYVSAFEVPEDAACVKFTIQVFSIDGSSQRLEESPFFEIMV